jgi:tetratricopeptide (TPR) repeat protein
LVEKRLYRQAAQAFERVHAFAPDDVFTRLYLGELNLLAQKPDNALASARDILEHAERFNLSPTNRVDALCLEAKAYFARREPERALALLESAIQASPSDDYLLASVISVYSESARYSNALSIIDRQLNLRPEDQSALLNKGFLYIQLNAFDDAIRTMTQLLAVTNRPDALLNRAIAYLRAEQLDPAQKDYESLQKLVPSARQVDYGLAEIAFRRKDTNAAIARCESYLSNAIPGAAETQFMENRLKELRGAKSGKR